MVKIIIFDLDDTIIKTYKLAGKRISKVLKKLCPEKNYSEKDVIRMVGLPLTEMHKRFLGDTKISYDRFHKELRKTMNAIPEIVEGADKTLKELSKKYKIGLITSREKSTYKILEHYNIKKFFSFIYDADDIEYNKPDKRLILSVIKKEGIKKEDTIFVGDSIYDIEMCNNAGIGIIHVKTGYYKEVDKKRVIASIENINHLANVLI